MPENQSRNCCVVSIGPCCSDSYSSTLTPSAAVTLPKRDLGRVLGSLVGCSRGESNPDGCSDGDERNWDCLTPNALDCRAGSLQELFDLLKGNAELYSAAN